MLLLYWILEYIFYIILNVFSKACLKKRPQMIILLLIHGYRQFYDL